MFNIFRRKKSKDSQEIPRAQKIEEKPKKSEIETHNRSRTKRKQSEKTTRYQCNSCGALQADGAWEKAMTRALRAQGLREFVNLSASPECLNCGSVARALQDFQ